jgi:hypothetical protein
MQANLSVQILRIRWGYSLLPNITFAKDKSEGKSEVSTQSSCNITAVPGLAHSVFRTGGGDVLHNESSPVDSQLGEEVPTFAPSQPGTKHMCLLLSLVHHT